MKKGLKIFISIIISLLILLIILFFSCFFYTKNQISPVEKENDKENVRIEISMGTSAYKISSILEENHIIKNSKFFYAFIRYPEFFKYFFPKQNFPEDIELKSGIYYLNPSMNYIELVDLLSSGQQEYLKILIPEGLTISKIGEILEENNICSKIEFRNLCYNQDIVNKYQIPGNSLEGFLFPDTYFFNPQMNTEEIIDMMIKNFWEKISTIENIDDKSIDEIYEKVKLASIVEREYRIPDEAPVISSVFVNRLRYNIGLYSCATVEYIITEIEGRPHPDRILIEDTRIDSPYNTYLYAGLPPTPISNPGLVSLNAAINPAKTKYYFFQIVDPVEGRHVFTSTFDEHKLSHNLYLKK